MPELRNETQTVPRMPFAVPALEAAVAGGGVATPERFARDDLRAQIARLERRLGELFASAFPRKGLDWRVGAVGGPRLLGAADLERVRDALVVRIREAEGELTRRGAQEEANRGLLERVIVEPGRYHWVRVSNEDVGEPGCKHWHSRPRWGILGMLMGWWRVKLSSGCPLAQGGGPCKPSHLSLLARSSRSRRSLRSLRRSVCVS